MLATITVNQDDMPWHAAIFLLHSATIPHYFHIYFPFNPAWIWSLGFPTFQVETPGFPKAFICLRGRVTKWPEAFSWMLCLAFQEVMACRTPIDFHHKIKIWTAQKSAEDLALSLERCKAQARTQWQSSMTSRRWMVNRVSAATLSCRMFIWVQGEHAPGVKSRPVNMELLSYRLQTLQFFFLCKDQNLSPIT